MFLPISRNVYATPLALAACAATVAVQCFVFPSQTLALLINFIWAIVLSAGIWDLIDRNHFGHAQYNYSFSIGTIILTSVFNFTHLFIPDGYDFWEILLSASGVFLIAHITISHWQQPRLPMQALLMGLLLGIISTFMPHYLYYIILFPIIFYMMHSLSGANFMGLLAGSALGIWMAYVCTFFFGGDAMSDTLIASYGALADFQFLQLLDYSTWVLLFGGFLLFLILFHSLSSLFSGSADSVRMFATLKMLSFLSIILFLPVIFDSAYLNEVLCLMALFLSMQVSMTEAHSQTTASESWILGIEIILLALNVVPLFIDDIIALF